MKAFLKKTLLSLAVLGAGLLNILALAQPSLATTAPNVLNQITSGGGDIGFVTGTVNEPTQLITTALQYLMVAIVVIAVVMIIIGGIRYATSGGNADKVKTAKNTILYAVIGLAVALLALVIVNLVQTQTQNLVK